MSEAIPAWQPFDPSNPSQEEIAVLAGEGLVALVCSDEGHAEGWGPEVAKAAATYVAESGRPATLYDLALDSPKLTATAPEGVTDLVRYGASLAHVVHEIGPLRLVAAGTVDANPGEVLRDAALLAAVKAGQDDDGGSAFLYVPSGAAGVKDVVAAVRAVVWIGRQDEHLPTWLTEGAVDVLAVIGPPSERSGGAVDSKFAGAAFEHVVDDVVDEVPFEAAPSSPSDEAKLGIDTGARDGLDEVEIDLDEGFADPVGSPVGSLGEVEYGDQETDPAAGPPSVTEGESAGDSESADDPGPVDDLEPVGELEPSDELQPSDELEPSEDAAAREEPAPADVEGGGLEIEPTWPDFGDPLVVADPGEIDPLDAARRDRPSAPASFDFGIDLDVTPALDDAPASDPGAAGGEGGGLEDEHDDFEPHIDLDEELGAASPDPWEGTGTFEPETAPAPEFEPETVRSGDPQPDAAETDSAPEPASADPLPWERPESDVPDAQTFPTEADAHAKGSATAETAPIADVTRTVARPRRPRGFLYVLFILFLLTIVVLAWAGYVEIPGIDWFQGDTP